MKSYRIHFLATAFLSLLLTTAVSFGQAHLTPAQMVAEALASNPDLESLAARVAQRESEAATAEANRLPSLGLSASSLHRNDPFRVRPATANNQSGGHLADRLFLELLGGRAFRPAVTINNKGQFLDTGSSVSAEDKVKFP